MALTGELSPSMRNTSYAAKDAHAALLDAVEHLNAVLSGMGQHWEGDNEEMVRVYNDLQADLSALTQVKNHVARARKLYDSTYTFSD